MLEQHCVRQIRMYLKWHILILLLDLVREQLVQPPHGAYGSRRTLLQRFLLEGTGAAQRQHLNLGQLTATGRRLRRMAEI